MYAYILLGKVRALLEVAQWASEQIVGVDGRMIPLIGNLSKTT